MFCSLQIANSMSNHITTTRIYMIFSTDPVQTVVKEDLVDKGHQSKSPSPAPRQQQQQVETTSSSDNEDDGNASGKQRKGSKQRWVPLPLDMTATQGGGQGDYQAQEYKKSGKGKGKYPPSNYHGGYHQRAKGKENVAVNGGNDYSGKVKQQQMKLFFCKRFRLKMEIW